VIVGYVSGIDISEEVAILTVGLPIDFNIAHNALIQASQKPDLSVKVEEVSIMSPCFMADIDAKAGAVKDSDLTFGLTTWASGKNAVGPSSAKDISAYQVLDELVDYYMDRLRFPNLEVRLFTRRLPPLMTFHTDCRSGESLSGRSNGAALCRYEERLFK
jgi:hypothetical protein